tara:strand:- start:163 stop:333 length:171 start_codon:yes stop_codon:yes gene_type:complete
MKEYYVKYYVMYEIVVEAESEEEAKDMAWLYDEQREPSPSEVNYSVLEISVQEAVE